MSFISSKIAEVVKKIAELGAGVASSGFSYEPKMPKCLKK